MNYPSLPSLILLKLSTNLISNVVTPTTFPYFSSEDHNPYDLPNQFHKDYNFNVVDLDTSLLEEDTFNSYHSNNCQIDSQHNHLEIEIRKARLCYIG